MLGNTPLSKRCQETECANAATETRFMVVKKSQINESRAILCKTCANIFDSVSKNNSSGIHVRYWECGQMVFLHDITIMEQLKDASNA